MSIEEQVLAAVERLLAGGASFTSLGVQRIAAEAGIARTTFYGHFQDKPTLLMRLTETATQELFAQATAWVEDDDSTREQHVGTVLALVREFRRHELLLRAVGELAAYDPVIGPFWFGRIETWAAHAQARLERERARGRIPAALDPATAAAWIVWGTERTVALHVARNGPGADQAFAEQIARATWASMGRTDG